LLEEHPQGLGDGEVEPGWGTPPSGVGALQGVSYRDVEELLSERGVEVDHVTVYRWVLRFASLLADAARPCRRAVGDRWQVDET
jgi:transposase-like protein